MTIAESVFDDYQYAVLMIVLSRNAGDCLPAPSQPRFTSHMRLGLFSPASFSTDHTALDIICSPPFHLHFFLSHRFLSIVRLDYLARHGGWK